jgi:DNA polymerase
MADQDKELIQGQYEAVDLISLLTQPGSGVNYELEISGEELPEEPIEAAPIIKESSPSSTDASKPKISLPSHQATTKPTRTGKAGSPIVLTEISVENDSLERIAQEVSECQKCALCKSRNKTVPGAGPLDADIVFVGEAPGGDEDKTGVPFVGRAGQHFDKILTAAGFDRNKVFICNILKCRPPGNRNPTIPEMVSCTPFLQRQLKLIKPKIIACLGNVAVKYVISPQAPGITRIHGQWFDSIFKIPTMAMYHPSYLIRSENRAKGSPNWQMWQDIQALKRRYDSISKS